MLNNTIEFKNFVLTIVLNITTNQKQKFKQLYFAFLITIYNLLLIIFTIYNLLTTNIIYY